MKDGLFTLPSSFGAAETLDRLLAAVRSRGLVLFATIDHAEAAQAAGLRMNPASLVIFGSPRAGTPLMRQAPTLAIDLPLKALIWEDDEGRAWLSYNDPAWLAQRHGLWDLDATAMVWEYEGGSVGVDAGPAAVAAAGFGGLGVIENPPVLGAMAQALAAIAGSATRPTVS
jgi:uncharacterized protein (DUF302 family)